MSGDGVPTRVPDQRYDVTAVVPVKPLAMAKSRLALPVEQRRALALAFALDTVAALDLPVTAAALTA